MARVAGIQKHVIGCDIEYKCKQFLVLFGQLAEKKKQQRATNIGSVKSKSKGAACFYGRCHIFCDACRCGRRQQALISALVSHRQR